MNKYTRDEVEKSTLEYFNGDTLATKTWINKYCLKDSNDNLYEKTPDDMHWRIAKELARIENNYPNPISEDEIYETLKNFKYIIPQGGPMSGIGNTNQIVSLSNCFVIGNESDSYGGILLTDQELVQLAKRRGGIGLSVSHIRPKGTPVKNSALTSTGVVPFLERYSNSTREVAQDGRRGALMISTSIKSMDSEDFIDAKMEAGKVTGANVSVKIDDDFMNCVINKTPYIQQFPIESLTPKYTREIDATKLWKKIIHNAWKSAEPGVFFWDNIIKESIPDCYTKFGFKTTSTNPCIVGETMVAVADGRHMVSMKQLAEEGKDVDVYCSADDDSLVIRKMRNPRITGYKVPVYKLTLDDDNYVIATANHQFRLKNGYYTELKDLQIGDSLDILTKSTMGLHEVIKNMNSKSQNYFWFYDEESEKYIAEHRIICKHNNGDIIGNIIHHKDFNGLNNSPDNLIPMLKEDHDRLHGDMKFGKDNPIFKVIADNEKYGKWINNLSEACTGELNGNSKNISNEQLINCGIELTTKLKRRFSYREWSEFAKINNLPQIFTNYRKKDLGTIVEFSFKCSDLCGLEDQNHDTRLLQSRLNMIEQGYETNIIDNIVYVKRKCEAKNCEKTFWVDYDKREVSFCSHECAQHYLNFDKEIKLQRNNGILDYVKGRSVNIKNKQLEIFTNLKFNLNREPLLDEWENECKNQNIPYRLSKHSKSMVLSYSDLKESAKLYNHRVKSIEYVGEEDVYNGTVDEFHNFFVGGFETKNEFNKPNYLFINNLQCGEIPLCPYDSCRLLALNLVSFVENPYTAEATFNFELFNKYVIYAMKFMDDIVDLELEKIDQIMEKIISDPEDESTKRVEYELWVKIKEKTIQGRRTGLGITSEGDMLAALGLRYGTVEATNFAIFIHKTLAVEAYKTSILMSKERGCFGVWDYELEKNNPFIQRILNELQEEYVQMYKETGRRNIALLTIAPTGTVSLMTQTTSGIEPAFLIDYKRRRKVNPNDKNVKPTFVDEIGDSWEEYNVFHLGFIKWSEINGYNVEELKNMKDTDLKEIVKKSPYYGATSADVDWLEKVRMQGEIQKWVDHSISVTVNLPENVSEDIVSQVYETAWKSGCKGMTIYREGSRSGVLISKSEPKQNIFQENNAPKRPKVLPCDIYRFQNKGEKWIAFLGLMENKPYEIFTGLQDDIIFPNYVNKGEIVKIKEEDGQSRYDFKYVDKDGISQEFRGLSRVFNREFWNIAITVSTVLRHGVPLPNVIKIIDKLNFDGDSISSWKSGVKRAIKRYIKDGTVVKGDVCPECGSKNMIFKEGCSTCMDCGHSKCD